MEKIKKINSFQYTILSALALFLIIFSTCKSDNSIIFLDELEFYEIINHYGAPKRNTSFAGYQMNIHGRKFERGLGLHAPAELNIDLNGQAKKFKAYIGIDTAKYFYHNETALDSSIRNRDRWTFPADYVYDNYVDHDDFTKGGTAIIRILLDGEEVYNSDLMTADQEAKKIDIDTKGKKILSIIAEPTEDGSFTDFVNLADAKISYISAPKHPYIYCQSKDILVNHIGFHPEASKTCYLNGREEKEFEIINVSNLAVVHQGKMTPHLGHIGDYLVGDFSELKETGTFYIVCDNKRSIDFRIDKFVIHDCLQKQLEYVAQQRSGHPTIGWNPNQHLDDGIREDNGKYQDVSGGWYDACDVRKPTNTNAILLFALAKMALDENYIIPKDQLIDEIKWGNKFLFSMQEPEGYLMSSIAFGDYKKSDNKWTDNIKGNEDDRHIQTEAERVEGQLYFILSELLLAKYFKDTDPKYHAKCKSAAMSCYSYVFNSDTLTKISEYSLATLINCELYSIGKADFYKEKSIQWIDTLLHYKVSVPDLPLTIFGKTRRNKWGNFEAELIVDAMNTFASNFPNHPKAKACIASSDAFCKQFLMRLQNENAFQLMPWFITNDPEWSDKKTGDYYYRNFLHVGLNRSIAIIAYDMMQTQSVKNREAFAKRAQHQLDWIYGANPFNASHVIGLGHNQPSLFEAGNDAYQAPHTPEILGGVMTGICADKDDNPALYPGWWWSTEYWAPTVAAVILLENELHNYYSKK